MTRIAVLGATGATGRNIVEQLVDRDDHVLAVSRTSSDTDPRVTSVRLDLARADQAAIGQALADADADAVVFAAAGGPEIDHHATVRTIDAARAVGIERFVLLSAKGPGVQRPDWLSGGFWQTYFAAKEAAEAHLQQSSLDWTTIKPGELTNAPATGTVTLSADVLPFETISRADVAAVIVASLRQPASIGHAWEVVGGTTPIPEAIEAAGR